MDRRKNPSSVDIQKVLLDMREYRMGLIQTSDQLRFSYMAVIEGAKLILTDNSAAQVAQSRGCLGCYEMIYIMLVSSSVRETLPSETRQATAKVCNLIPWNTGRY